MKFEHRCVCCAKKDLMDDPPQEGALYLCQKCFKKVKKEYKKKHPGQSLRTEDVPDNKKTNSH